MVLPAHALILPESAQPDRLMPVQQPPFASSPGTPETTRFNTGYRPAASRAFSPVPTVFVGGADDIGNGLREFRFVVAGTVLHTHDNGDRF